uniref:Galectin n=1 Tax=Petromyzon marinus TaxID=7757 RepID=A0AAJ7TKU5_PETMA|nr:galectin-8 isoform X2 [Petromyzon marinus]
MVSRYLDSIAYDLHSTVTLVEVYKTLVEVYSSTDCTLNLTASMERDPWILKLQPASADEAQPSVKNPMLPFSMSIYEGFQVGKSITIEGYVPTNAERFHMELQIGSHIRPHADVALHVSVRLGSGCVVCNSMRAQRWGREEKTGGGTGPFVRGQSFGVTLIATEEEIQIVSAGRPYITYKHRLPLEEVDTFHISGPVTVSSIRFSRTLTAPCSALIPGGFTEGKTVLVRATVKYNPDRILVNLGQSTGPDIALHINPRFRKKEFVRNSLLCDAWGEEERAADSFPFYPGREFKMLIRCERGHFAVSVDDKPAFTFKQRVLRMATVDQVRVSGDLMLPNIEVQGVKVQP